jgi:LysR family transcriptional regulator, glycine cleavage system transcriptional activator
MTRELPPLMSARAFEAAARHLSFQGAAEELHVTPSAISHRVRSLESFLGVELFRRNYRGVALTAEGHAYLTKLQLAFDEIAVATAEIRQGKLKGRFALGATSAFLSRWMLPRLKRFSALFPGVNLDLRALVGSVDFLKQDLDMAITMGPQDWTGLCADRLMSSPLFTICSPAIGGSLKRPCDLLHQTLLHYDQGESWSRWLQAAGVEMNSSAGPRFNDCNLMLQAAVEGHGVGLSFTALAEREFREGLLMTPFDLRVLPDAWYYVISPSAELPKATAIREWILEEAKADVLRLIPLPSTSRHVVA